MKQKILITSALPYANGPLHFGHLAGAYLPADCYARFERLRGHDVLYICGSDEYGVAITLKAEQEKRTPQQHVDIYHAINKQFFDQMDLSFDHYSRTTSPHHQPIVHKFFLELKENGFIEERITDQLYSEQDQRFLADRYVVGNCPKCAFEKARGDECPKCGASFDATELLNPRSLLTGSTLTHKPTKHWFLLLDKFKERLTDWLGKKPWKNNVLNFAKKYIEEIHARSITRDLDWGVPIPLKDAEGKVFYVWFDAPIGYLSSTIEWAESQGKPELWKDYWCDPATKLVQFVGKDNIPFHAVIFPAMIMGQTTSYKLVDELPANEFYNLEGRQFSKSDGWYIDLKPFFEKYSSDQIRYAIAANAPETGDSEFTWKDFQMRCNAELVGKLGNLANRTLVFTRTHCQSSCPPRGALEAVDRDFLERIDGLVDEAARDYGEFKLRKACRTLMELASLGNTYFDQKKPWFDARDARQASSKSAMETTIACCFHCLKSLALIAHPVIPSAAVALWKLLGFTQPLTHFTWETIKTMEIPTGQAIPIPTTLFRKVENEEIDKEIAALKNVTPTEVAPVTAAFEPLKEQIAFEDFSKMDLRVGTILSAQKVQKSKKLLLLTVDIGLEKRQIVSGISLHFEPEALVGKKVIVVANLKPAELMGIRSEGMILAASLDKQLELVNVATMAPGSSVS